MLESMKTGIFAGLILLACQSSAIQTKPGLNVAGGALTVAPSVPSTEQAWLERLIGAWETTSEMTVEPGAEPQRTKGHEIVRPLGNDWVVAEVEGQMPDGGSMSAVLSIGYNHATQRFWGTWIDSVMGHLWIYDGSLDAAQRVLTLESKGPSFEDPAKQATYRDAIEWVDEEHRILRSSVQNADGSWTAFMTTRYRRK